jgi:glyoxylase-like metal-dependent hydrolase (beta-lactamase superfamily II)
VRVVLLGFRPRLLVQDVLDCELVDPEPIPKSRQFGRLTFSLAVPALCAPGVEIVVQKSELRYAFAPDGVQRLFYLTGDIVDLRRLDATVTPITGEYDVFGDGSVVAFPTPGHTPGHQSLQVELPDAGTVLLTSDVANHRQGYEEELVASFAWSLEDSIDSLHDVKDRVRRHDADVYVHHDGNDIGNLPAPPEALE